MEKYLPALDLPVESPAPAIWRWQGGIFRRHNIKRKFVVSQDVLVELRFVADRNALAAALNRPDYRSGRAQQILVTSMLIGPAARPESPVGRVDTSRFDPQEAMEKL
jgi:hypothetical protein